MDKKPAVQDSRQTYRQEHEQAVRAAQRAADLIRRRAGRVEEETIREKGVHDLLTRTDEEAQRLIVEVLTEAFPEYEVLAEEGAEDWSQKARGHRWIIDPIDGTTNFTHGVPPYAVSIALQHEAEIVVGVVLDVAADELFSAVRGSGIYVDGRPAQVSKTQVMDKALLATGFPYRTFEQVDRYLEVLGCFMRRSRGIRRHGAASVDLAWLACGRFDGFFETGLSPWDVAAGVLLVEEGGGRVTDYRGEGHPIFDRQILATNGLLHEPMLEVLHAMRDVRS